MYLALKSFGDHEHIVSACSNFDVLSYVCCFCASDVETNQQKGTEQEGANSAPISTFSADPLQPVVVDTHQQIQGATAGSPHSGTPSAVAGLPEIQDSCQLPAPRGDNSLDQLNPEPQPLSKTPIPVKNSGSQGDPKPVGGDITDKTPAGRKSDTAKKHNKEDKLVPPQLPKSKKQKIHAKRDEFVNSSQLETQARNPKTSSREVISVDDECPDDNTDWPGKAPSTAAYDKRLAQFRQQRTPEEYRFKPGTIVVYCESDIQEFQRAAYVADYDADNNTVDLIFPKLGSGSYEFSGGVKSAASALFCFLATDYVLHKGRRFQFSGPPRRQQPKQSLLILYRFKDISGPKEKNKLGITNIDVLDYVVFPRCKGLVLGCGEPYVLI